MRLIISASAALAAALIAGAARAADAPDAQAAQAVQATFGNTVFSMYADGRSQKIWLHPDGTWIGKSRRGKDLAGKWTVKGEKVCMTQSKPRLFGSMCEVFPSDPKVGIDAKDPMGKTVHLKLVKGRVTK